MILRLSFIAITIGVLVGITLPQSGASAESAKPSLEALLKLHTDGNHKEAYDGLRSFVLEQKPASSADAIKAFDAAVNCLQQLNRTNEIDDFREKAVKARASDWQVLAAIARS